MDTTTLLATIFIFLIGLACAATSFYMFKTNKIPAFGKNSISVDEPRQAGVLFILFSVLAFAVVANLLLSAAPSTIPPLDFIFPAILFLSGLSFPILLICASFYGRRTQRIYGYINTPVARPYLKRYAKPVNTLMLIAGITIAIGTLALAARGLFGLLLPMIVPGIFFAIGVITCSVMSGLMLKMETALKRAVKSAKPHRTRSKSKTKSSHRH